MNKLRHVCLSFLLAVLAGCATDTGPDAIDRLVTALSDSHGLWVNGTSPTILLKGTASTREVLDQVFASESGRKITHYKVTAERNVHIEGGLYGTYTAALAKTDSGNWIVLFRYQDKTLGWWTQVYDAATDQKAQ